MNGESRKAAQYSTTPGNSGKFVGGESELFIIGDNYIVGSVLRTFREHSCVAGLMPLRNFSAFTRSKTLMSQLRQ